MAVAWFDPVNISPGSSTGWSTIDISAYVPVGTTLAVIRVNQRHFGAITVSYRDPDTKVGPVAAAIHPSNTEWVVPVHDQTIEITRSSAAIDYYLHGAVVSDGDFIPSFPDLLQTTYDTWVDVDLSAYVPEDASLAFLWVAGNNGATMGVRAKGSTLDLVSTGSSSFVSTVAVPLPEDKTIQVYHPNSSFNRMHLVGWLTDGVVTHIDPLNVTPSSGTGWQELQALPSGATGGFFLALRADTNANWSMRPKGGTAPGSLRNLRGLVSPAEEVGTDDLIEVNRSSDTLSFYLVAHTVEAEEGDDAEAIAVSGAIELVGSQGIATASAHVTATASTGAIAASGSVPVATASDAKEALAGSGSADIAGSQPGAAATANVASSSGSGAAEIAGQSAVATSTANVAALAQPGSADIVGTIAFADANAGVTARAASGSAHLAGSVPVAAASANVSSHAQPGALEIGGGAPQAQASAHVAALAGGAATHIVGQTPVVMAGQSAIAASGAAEISGSVPGSVVTAHVGAIAGAGSAGITGVVVLAHAGDNRDAIAASARAIVVGASPLVRASNHKRAFASFGEGQVAGRLARVTVTTNARSRARPGEAYLSGRIPVVSAGRAAASFAGPGYCHLRGSATWIAIKAPTPESRRAFVSESRTSSATQKSRMVGAFAGDMAAFSVGGRSVDASGSRRVAA